MERRRVIGWDPFDSTSFRSGRHAWDYMCNLFEVREARAACRCRPAVQGDSGAAPPCSRRTARSGRHIFIYLISTKKAVKLTAFHIFIWFFSIFLLFLRFLDWFGNFPSLPNNCFKVANLVCITNNIYIHWRLGDWGWVIANWNDNIVW